MYFIKNKKAYLLLHTDITQDVAEEANSFVYGLEFYDEVEEIVVSINSGGGSVIAGFSIFNALRNSSKKVTTVNEFLAGSMAGIVFLAGDNREMADVALFMLHNPSGGDEKVLSKIKDSLMKILGRDFKENLDQWMDKETWLNASEMQDLGIINKVINTDLESTLDFEKPVHELANIVNQGSLKNKYINLQSDMKIMKEMKENQPEKVEEVKNEKVEENTEKVEDITEEVKSENEENKEEKESSELDLLKEEISSLHEKLETLTKKNETLETELSNYKEEEVKSEKLQILNSSAIDKQSFDNWMNLDLETIKNLVPTVKVSKASPAVEIKNETELDYDKMTVEERKELLNSNPDAFAQLLRNKK